MSPKESWCHKRNDRCGVIILVLLIMYVCYSQYQYQRSNPNELSNVISIEWYINMNSPYPKRRPDPNLLNIEWYINTNPPYPQRRSDPNLSIEWYINTKSSYWTVYHDKFAVSKTKIRSKLVKYWMVYESPQSPAVAANAASNWYHRNRRQ